MIQVPDEIKALLHQDTCRKNIRIHFPNDERADICNSLIVKDTVSFTESICSQETLKFGLCEAAVFECETVGVGNIKGATIEVSCEVYCDSNVSGAVWKNDLEAYVYPVPYGSFVVNTCQRQADLNHRRIVAYGGTANLDRKNPIIEEKNSAASFPTTVPYTPDIFSSMMMISEAKGRLSDATYTELVPTDVGYPARIIIGYDNASPTTHLLLAECIVYTVTAAHEDKLYYAEVPDFTKTRAEIINELFVPDTYYERDALSPSVYKPIYGSGIITQLSVDGSRGVLQNGLYVYPYQILRITGNQGVLFAVPYKLLHTMIEDHETVVLSESQYRDPNEIVLYSVDTSNYPQYRAYAERDIKDSTYNWYYFDPANIDYVKLMNASLDLQGCFANIDHKGEFKVMNIKQQFDLLPETTLYPSGALYPEGSTGGELLPNDYRTCWYDDQYTLPFGAVSCVYIDTNDIENKFTYYLSGYSDSNTERYQVYDFSDNEILKMYKWTQNQIQAICQTIAGNIEGVTYMPVEFVGRGLPYVEAGDTFEVLTKLNDSITTIVLNRTLTGEQTLTDTYKSV